MISARPLSHPMEDVLAKQLQDIMRAFRKKFPLTHRPWSAGSFLLPMCLDGRPTAEMLIWYPTPGCSKARVGGCTMCNFGWEPLPNSSEDVVAIFQQQLAQIDPGIRYIHLGPGGSVFDQEELSSSCQKKILQSLHVLPFLVGVGFETWCNAIKNSMLRMVEKAIPSTVRELVFGVGVESCHDLVRRCAVGKNLRSKTLKKRFARIKAFSPSRDSLEICLETYLLLKPPFLTEKEAVDDMLDSVTWSFQQGAAYVMIFVNTIKENTLCDWLHQQMEVEPPLRYEPPYLFSVIDVLRRLPPEWAARTLVSGLVSSVPAKIGPRECPFCANILRGILVSHAFSRDPALLHVASQVRCPCRERWQQEMKQPSPPLSERLPAYLQWIEDHIDS